MKTTSKVYSSRTFTLKHRSNYYDLLNISSNGIESPSLLYEIGFKF